MQPSVANAADAEGAQKQLGSIVMEATLAIEAGRYDSAVRKAQQAAKVAQASSDPPAVVLSERIMAQTDSPTRSHWPTGDTRGVGAASCALCGPPTLARRQAAGVCPTRRRNNLHRCDWSHRPH